MQDSTVQNLIAILLSGCPAGVIALLMLVIAGNSSLALSIPLVLLPWAVAGRLNMLARLLYGLFWLAGLLMFALAVRSLVVWWLLTIPLCALALESIKTLLRRRPHGPQAPRPATPVATELPNG